MKKFEIKGIVSVKNKHIKATIHKQAKDEKELRKKLDYMDQIDSIEEVK